MLFAQGIVVRLVRPYFVCSLLACDFVLVFFGVRACFFVYICIISYPTPIVAY